MTTRWISSLFSRCGCQTVRNMTRGSKKGGQMEAIDSHWDWVFSKRVIKYRMTLCFARNPVSSLVMLAPMSASNGLSQARTPWRLQHLPSAMTHYPTQGTYLRST